MDSPFQQVPRTPLIDEWTTFYDCKSQDAVVPSERMVTIDRGHTFSVPSTPVVSRPYSSPFIPLGASSRPMLIDTPQQLLRTSTSSSTRPYRTGIPAEQVVPTTPKGQVETRYTLGTPTSSMKRPLHRRQVFNENPSTLSIDNAGIPVADKDPVSTIVIDETGDHHRPNAVQQNDSKRRHIARKRKSLMLVKSLNTQSTPDILDEIFQQL